MSHPWPGNVRELKHTIEYMMNVCEEDVLSNEDLPMMMKQKQAVTNGKGEKRDLSLRKNVEGALKVN